MQQPIDIVNTPGRYSPHLLSLDFFKGFDFYSQLCMLIGFERAGVLVDRITEYCSPHIEQLNVFLAQISTSHEFNPKPEHGKEDLTVYIEGLIVMLGIELHRAFYENNLFVPEEFDKFPYEVHAIASGRIILRKRVMIW